MSKLTLVRMALQNNPKIMIVGAPERNHLPDRSECWSHTMDLYVAPRVGVYEAEELQAMMMSLVPGLEPTRKDDFRDCDHDIEFGKLYFDEVIGTEYVRREIVLSDEELFSTSGFTDGKLIIENVLQVQRRTWVSLFPDVEIATAALEGVHEFRIPKRYIAYYSGILAPPRRAAK